MKLTIESSKQILTLTINDGSQAEISIPIRVAGKISGMIEKARTHDGYMGSVSIESFKLDGSDCSLRVAHKKESEES